MLNRPLIVIEDKIPFIKGRFEPYAEVRYLHPDQFRRETVADADAMIVRTRTRCACSRYDRFRNLRYRF